ncbi:hypothetical protein EYF80_030315 [Liparis tanakae]|uniref:Uncharacterized protein n=1 Tax=Liparis tanakae TaxID=230148 RepID=A0A4Z2H213_9TELE|nr:hypothetical protein EYF80_030315 [Liparis tanakae]
MKAIDHSSPLQGSRRPLDSHSHSLSSSALQPVFCPSSSSSSTARLHFPPMVPCLPPRRRAAGQQERSRGSGSALTCCFCYPTPTAISGHTAFRLELRMACGIRFVGEAAGLLHKSFVPFEACSSTLKSSSARQRK